MPRRASSNLVVVWRLDRLGRSLKHLLKLLDELTSHGVGFTSLRNPGIDTTTATGRLLLQILGAFAEFEPIPSKKGCAVSLCGF
jgi:DNA invertase Pin-like site-specific DNA recombinase